MNKEIIKNFVKVDAKELGYEIHTDQQVINLLIGNEGDCCERWGVITTEDKLSDFVGAELLSLEVIKADYDAHPLMANHKIYEGGACFIDVNTSNGKLQFALYNEHNGYYVHEVKISSNQLKYETVV